MTTSDNNKLNHLAIIMDGNGRWAESRGLSRSEGHKAGARAVRPIVEACVQKGIRYLTLYAFSTENWKRSAHEVKALMKLLELYLKKELPLFLENQIRLRVTGDKTKLPKALRTQIDFVEEKTQDFDRLQLILALSYGGRAEIISAAHQLCQAVQNNSLSLDEIDENTFRRYLYLPDVPDPDLLLRTSGESRVSNFLLWQIAYSEICISDVYWPDFSVQELESCITDFYARDRRFGKTSGSKVRAI